MQFTKLRLQGFKSFVDPTEVMIEPGLTGVVGPNGCGKSNLVEALRWVMGETSPKSMRGGGMDDVIFSGTANRPARNVAEVALALDNAGRMAPSQFNSFPELEVSRRIERGCGSQYRVNGKEVRARDVQLLFADAATGAHSPAIVSQGRVGAVINAKPGDRRSLLEEAAGITGLHSRRHEAELRLRAAEANLERLDDVVTTLETQLQGLKKQARQANRYRKLSDLVRRHEAILLHQEWQHITAELDAAGQCLEDAERTVADLTGEAATAAAERADAVAALPPLRQAEAEAAAALQRLLLERETLVQEEARIAGERARAEQRLAQARADLDREQRLLEDATTAARRLEAEATALEAAAAGDQEAQAKARAGLESAQQAVATAESDLSALTERIADGEARSTALARQADDLAERRRKLRGKADEIAAEQASLTGHCVDPAGLQSADRSVVETEAAVEDARRQADEAEQASVAARASESTCRDQFQALQAELGKLDGEASALAELLADGDEKVGAPIIDALDVTPGFEAALAAALGDDLSATDNVSSPVHWCDLPVYTEAQPLPASARPLSDVARGPAVLARRLSQIGVVADARIASRLQGDLRPGQRLVTHTGGLWRWDGFTTAPGTPTAAETRLKQHNRLAEIRSQRPGLENELRAAHESLEEARTEAEAAAAAERSRRHALHAAFQVAGSARETRSKLVQQAAATNTRLSVLQEAATRLDQEIKETEEATAAAQTDRAALPDLEGARSDATRQREALGRLRSEAGTLQSDLDRLLRESEVRRARLQSLTADRELWEARGQAATRQCAELREREQVAHDELEELSAKPAEIAARRAVLAGHLEQAETQRKAEADKLAAAENRLAAADTASKAAEARLGEAREDRVRAQSGVALHRQHLEALAERTHERLACPPEQVLENVGLESGADLPDRDAVDAKLQRLLRERDSMGPVNLRAEQEAEELDKRIVELQHERGDLTSAIARLRQGIASLNREGRERLLAAFEHVNRHFTELFVRLFGGGRAHLELTPDEDPLEAGLEIFASPPGKRLQVLSLLSGGEQALTATALLFAVFLTNPAPICVMDEVDAPLDDANVDRFCSLLGDLAEETRTRFIVITHNPITMARMDRLFGVTMADRGISQLVSVDLVGGEHLAAAE